MKQPSLEHKLPKLVTPKIKAYINNVSYWIVSNGFYKNNKIAIFFIENYSFE